MYILIKKLSTKKNNNLQFRKKRACRIIDNFDFWFLYFQREKLYFNFFDYIRVKGFCPHEKNLIINPQQLRQSQLPISHEVLIETETKFRNALKANISTEETKQTQIINIISPFSREIVKSAENLTQAYRSCASDILKQFPTTMQ